jgi:hypothetical protein
MTAQGGIGTRPTRIRVGSASKPPDIARRATYFELSRPFLSHASPRHPAGRPTSLFMTVRHGTRYAAMSYVGPPRLRMVRLRGRRPSVTRHGAADAYSADAPEPPPRSWSQRVVQARRQDARVPADLRASDGARLRWQWRADQGDLRAPIARVDKARPLLRGGRRRAFRPRCLQAAAPAPVGLVRTVARRIRSRGGARETRALRQRCDGA